MTDSSNVEPGSRVEPATESGGATGRCSEAPGSALVAFKCVACGAEGHVESPREMERVNCECGAGYIYWPHWVNKCAERPWKCVVRPVFVDEPNGKAD